MIELQGISKKYSTRNVLVNLSFQIHPGEIFLLFGRNGAGKTTTLQLLSGITFPTKGSILAYDIPLVPQIPDSLRIGLLVEKPEFEPFYTAWEQLKYYTLLRNDTEGESMIDLVLRRFGLDPDNPKPIDTYSLGAKKKLGLAQAFLHKPQLLLLDEPFSDLDLITSKVLISSLEELAKEGCMILIATSHLQYVEYFQQCTIGYLQNGSLSFQGSLPELKKKASGPYNVQIRINPLSPEIMAAFQEEWSKKLNIKSEWRPPFLALQLHDESILPQITHDLVLNGVQIYEITPVQPKLTDFLIHDSF